MNTCGICLEIISDPVSGNCTHRFCRTCYSNWLNVNRSCPTCRMSINEVSSLCFSDDSIIRSVGLSSIHEYTLRNHVTALFEKGKDVEILQSEREFIKNLTGFIIGDKTSQDINNKLVCLINGNIITIGNKIDNNENNFYIKDGIAIIRETKVTFPVTPRNRLYNRSNRNIIYKIK